MLPIYNPSSVTFFISVHFKVAGLKLQFECHMAPYQNCCSMEQLQLCNFVVNFLPLFAKPFIKQESSFFPSQHVIIFIPWHLGKIFFHVLTRILNRQRIDLVEQLYNQMISIVIGPISYSVIFSHWSGACLCTIVRLGF
jgi:hypothetical protein